MSFAQNNSSNAHGNRKHVLLDQLHVEFARSESWSSKDQFGDVTYQKIKKEGQNQQQIPPARDSGTQQRPKSEEENNEESCSDGAQIRKFGQNWGT